MHNHRSSGQDSVSVSGSIALVGHPNVGKSALFQRLTGQHVDISNYPGTTVELTRGMARGLPGISLVDTPGVIALPPQTEDEFVTTRILYQESLQAILQVGDAKNVRRTLQLTLQLAEMGIPLVLVLNMIDEASSRGVKIDIQKLSEIMGIPVIPTTAIRGVGIEELKRRIPETTKPGFKLDYPQEIEASIQAISQHLPTANISSRSIALFWLCRDPVTENWLFQNLDERSWKVISDEREKVQKFFSEPTQSVIQGRRIEFIQETASSVILDGGTVWQGFSTRLGHLATHPFWGTLILAGVLYALYWFVGVLGAGILVDWFENTLFGQYINPWFTGMVTRWVPLPVVADFLIGDYGIWTMGVTYAFALILPIVTTFFLAFGIMEDSGYLPRLAALSNTLFRYLGLNGKAVLPMVLGLGCVTMATLTTRVLENKRDRILVILLLALAVPCSAQLGVVLGMLAGISLGATMIWGGIIFLVLLGVGWLAARLIPGERSQLLVEVPPLRFPVISNVLMKTLARLEWYLKEVVPLFLIGAVLMFFLDLTGILDGLIRVAQPLVTGWLGLPAEASAAFLMGFLRRDFGATGLFVMESQGLLSARQVVVSMVTVTLFVPCIANVMVVAKERGWKTALGIIILVFPLAFLVGGILDRLLRLVGWGW